MNYLEPTNYKEIYFDVPISFNEKDEWIVSNFLNYFPKNKIIYGSTSTHTIMSYFDINLEIVTLLEGERKVNQPIHKNNYYKTLEKNVLSKGIRRFEQILKKYI